MLSKRILVSALAVAAVSLSPLFAADQKPAAKATPKAEAAAAPRVTLVEPVKDAGIVPKGQKIDWAFEVKNTGTADLEIKSAQPSCGCTVTDFDKVIKPGQTGKVTAHVDTSAFAGPIQKHITIMTNDPENPTAQLTLNASIKPYVEALPAGFIRYSIMQGDADTKSVVLYSEEDQPFEVTGIDVPEGGFVKAKFTKIDDPAQRVEAGRKEQNQYKIDVTLGGPDVKIGPLAEKVIVHTNSKFQPEYPISLSGVIRPTYLVMPTALNFGEITSDPNSMVRTLSVASNDHATPETFKVMKVESTVAGVSAEAKPTEQKGMFEVVVKVGSDAKPGDFAGQLKVYTNDKINPVATIPVRGTVKAAEAKADAKTK